MSSWVDEGRPTTSSSGPTPSGRPLYADVVSVDETLEYLSSVKIKR
jgi:hypothetical protein